MTVIGCLVLIVLCVLSEVSRGHTAHAGQEMEIVPKGTEPLIKPAGVNVLFTCNIISADGITQVQNLRWLNTDNKQITDTMGRVYIEQEDQQSVKLFIANIAERDAGTYKCVGTVEGNELTESVQLHLFKDITFDNAPKTQNPVEYTDALIICRVSGRPTPTYSWKYRGKKLHTGGRYIVDPLEGLKILNISEEDNGLYTCQAEVPSDGRLDHRQITVVVHIPPKVYDYRNVSQQESKIQKLVCLSEGEPAPDMNFRKVGNAKPYDLGENENGRIMVENPQSGRLEMTINNLKPEDTSNYTCNSQNIAGFAEQNGTLTVLYAPRFVEGQQTEFYGWAGKTRNMTCQTDAEPAPVIEWFHFGKLLETNETYRIIPLIKNSVLQIKVMQAEEIWIFNQYTCRARNSYGTNEVNMEFKRAIQPGRPTSVEVVEESPTRIVLKVTPPDDDGGMPLIGYRVEFESVVCSYLIGDGTRDTMVIDHLRPSVIYVFNVRAENEVDVSTPFRLDYKTKPFSKPYPLSISSEKEGLNPYEYTLTWKKTETGVNSIKEYKFTIRKVEVNPDTNKIKPLEDWTVKSFDDDKYNPKYSYKLTGLKPNTWYEVQAQARNDIGYSNNTAPFLFKTTPDQVISGSGASETVIKTVTVVVSVTAIIIAKYIN